MIAAPPTSIRQSIAKCFNAPDSARRRSHIHRPEPRALSPTLSRILQVPRSVSGGSKNFSNFLRHGAEMRALPRGRDEFPGSVGAIDTRISQRTDSGNYDFHYVPGLHRA